MVWAIANRNGYASCHGGQKEYTLADGSKFVASVYGLSGSGKSTLTHAKHGGKYEIKVLHDDAFIINTDTCASIAIDRPILIKLPIIQPAVMTINTFSLP